MNNLFSDQVNQRILRRTNLPFTSFSQAPTKQVDATANFQKTQEMKKQALPLFSDQDQPEGTLIAQDALHILISYDIVRHSEYCAIVEISYTISC
ncbi:hypothetical protein AVEN_82798-1 [Araneus ventricosus]|uniref:Uncharacterized protein n=1 Tax=Araneus ventricosus TaxID=182803 RepID=A0A4Y2DBC4_ARAVE|nr:hypothetical protein AVEN_82798-1 [Araneus ventricosus]